MMIASYGLYAVGAGLIVAGIVVLTSEPDPDPNNRLRAPSLGVAPLIGPGITGAQAEWRF